MFATQTTHTCKHTLGRTRTARVKLPLSYLSKHNVFARFVQHRSVSLTADCAYIPRWSDLIWSDCCWWWFCMIYSLFLLCACVIAVASIVQNKNFFASKSEGRFNFTMKSLSLLTVHGMTILRCSELFLRCKFRRKEIDSISTLCWKLKKNVELFWNMLIRSHSLFSK